MVAPPEERQQYARDASHSLLRRRLRGWLDARLALHINSAIGLRERQARIARRGTSRNAAGRNDGPKTKEKAVRAEGNSNMMAATQRAICHRATVR